MCRFGSACFHKNGEEGDAENLGQRNYPYSTQIGTRTSLHAAKSQPANLPLIIKLLPYHSTVILDVHRIVQLFVCALLPKIVPGFSPSNFPGSARRIMRLREKLFTIEVKVTPNS